MMCGSPAGRSGLVALGCTIAVRMLGMTSVAQRDASPSDASDRWLAGSIDIHVHSAPDNVERSGW
jgi:hypothetical protein